MSTAGEGRRGDADPSRAENGRPPSVGARPKARGAGAERGNAGLLRGVGTARGDSTTASGITIPLGGAPRALDRGEIIGGCGSPHTVRGEVRGEVLGETRGEVVAEAPDLAVCGAAAAAAAAAFAAADAASLHFASAFRCLARHRHTTATTTTTTRTKNTQPSATPSQPDSLSPVEIDAAAGSAPDAGERLTLGVTLGVIDRVTWLCVTELVPEIEDDWLGVGGGSGSVTPSSAATQPEPYVYDHCHAAKPASQPVSVRACAAHERSIGAET